MQIRRPQPSSRQGLEIAASSSSVMTCSRETSPSTLMVPIIGLDSASQTATAPAKKADKAVRPRLDATGTTFELAARHILYERLDILPTRSHSAHLDASEPPVSERRGFKLLKVKVFFRLITLLHADAPLPRPRHHWVRAVPVLPISSPLRTNARDLWRRTYPAVGA